MRKTNKPHVQDGMLFDISSSRAANIPIPVGSKSWFEWLEHSVGFVYEGNVGHFTARRELRRGIGYWYAYRRVERKLSKVYLGRAEELTGEHLEKASAQLAGQIPVSPLVVNGHSVDLNSRLDSRPPSISLPVRSAKDLYIPPLTKITPPPLPQKLISRPQLSQRINTPITVIYAPSGYGTTTVLNEWRQNSGIPVAWVSLDQEDNNPAYFWSSVVTALQSVIPGLGVGWLSQLRASSPFTLSTIAANLADDIVRATNLAHSPHGVGLVLDNYHFIRNTEIHTSLQTMVDHMPPTLKLVIAGHTRPPLALGYLRAKGLATELDADDLRFSVDESIEYLLQNAPEPYLAYSQMQTLHHRTEGWITGLVLAVPVLVEEWDRSKFADIYTGAYPLLQDFFKANVFDLQTKDMETFFTKTSILEYLTGPLCDAVTGRNDSAAILSRLMDRNLFIERLEKPGWYRYNKMFAEVLAEKLNVEYPDEKLDLHRKAADWYISQNAHNEAIYHLLAGNSWEEAAVFIEKAALAELEQFGEDSRLLSWLLKLPDEVMIAHPKLLALYTRLGGYSFSAIEMDNVLHCIETKINEKGAGSVEEQQEIIDIQQVRALLTRHSAVHLESMLDVRGHEATWETLDGIIDYYSDFRSDIHHAADKARELYEKAQQSNSLFGIMMAGGNYASLEFSQGHLRQSEQIAHQVLRQAFAICGKFPEPTCISLIALARVCYMRNQLSQAHQLLNRASDVNPNPVSTVEPLSIAILRAKIQSAQGDNEAAFSTIQASREIHSTHISSIWLNQDLISYLRLFRLRQGISDFSRETPMDQLDIENSPFSALVQAEIHLEQKRNVAAEEILTNLIARYPYGCYMLPIIQPKIMLAIAYFDQRKLKEAFKVLTEVSRLAAPEYCIRPFLDYGPRLESLLSWVLHSENLSSGSQTFLKGILTMLGKEDGAQRILPSEEAQGLSIAASISPREQEILRFLSRGLSNREIAQQCFISPSTVKTHIENIYNKLGVNSRLQAIAQAQMLNLI